MPQVEAIVHNSPALDSLKHQQLRSLCARHNLKSTGKRDHLIKRLKGLRDRPSTSNNEASSEVDAPLDGSFDFVDDEESEEAQINSTLPGSFESSRSIATTLNTRPSMMNSRVSIDEFGSLSGDAQTITRSSSWKDKLASVFGGGSNASTISHSSSSDSLSSIRTARGGGDVNSARASTSAESSLSSRTLSANTYSSASSSSHLSNTQRTALSHVAQQQQQPPTPVHGPAFRIVEDSFTQGNSTVYPDCSFVPRTSFEGDSIDLQNAVVWPPRPGVILISPRQSPAKPGSSTSNIASTTMIPASAQKKRYLDDVEEDDFDDNEEGRYGSIRLIPKMKLESTASSVTPGRRIAQLPKKMSIIAASPPRFDLEAPPLPSFALVANQAIQQDRPELDHVVMMQESSTDTITMQEVGDTKPSSDIDERPSQPQQPFIFGSPRQQPLTNDSFMKKIDGFAIAKQLEELQRRTGTVAAVPADGRLGQKAFMPRSASNSNLQGGNAVRFEDKHQKEFKMMDSIASHYAARRKLPASDTPNKRTRTESADAASTLSRPTVSSTSSAKQNNVHRQASCPALSLTNTTSGTMGVNQQGRFAPSIPPRPKAAKSSAQQAQDRERIRNMQAGGVGARRAGRGSVSPRKAAVINPSTRKMPPLPSTSSSIGSIGANSTGTASKLFKSTLSSLKSFGSSASLSSKAGASMMTESTSSRNISQTSQVSDFGTLQTRGPSAVHNSLNRPTIASLARQASRQNLDTLASPGASHTTASISSKSSTSTLQHALSPRTIPTSENRSNIASPRPPFSAGLDKKKVSSLTAAQRSSPLKGGLDESISQARRIRAKKLGAQMQQNRVPSASSLASTITMPRSPSKSAGLMANASTTGSINARPAWR